MSGSHWGYATAPSDVLALVGSRLYAGTDNGVYRASLGSTAPEWIALGPAARAIEALLVLSPDTVLTAVALTGTGSDTVALFRTTDGGQAWRPYQNGFGGGTEAKGVLAIAELTGESAALLATGGAAVVAKSDDGGLHWRVVWGDWQLGAVGTHYLVFTGMEGRLVKSADGGQTWHTVL